MSEAGWIVGEVLRDVRAWMTYERRLARPHGERLMKLEAIADRMERLALMVEDVSMDRSKLRPMSEYRPGDTVVVFAMDGTGGAGESFYSTMGPKGERESPDDFLVGLAGWLPLEQASYPWSIVDLSGAPDYSLFDRLYAHYLAAGATKPWTVDWRSDAQARAASDCAFVGADFRVHREQEAGNG